MSYVYRYQKEREKARWECYDFYDVRDKLYELWKEIPSDVVDIETFDISLDELRNEINKRINEKIRVITREIREIKKQLKRG